MNEYESDGIQGAPAEKPTRRKKLPRWLQSNRNRWIASSALMVGTIGSSVGVATLNSTNPASTSAAASTSAGHAFEAVNGSGNGKSNARTAPAPGGTTGKIDTVSDSSFTLTTPAGQKVTVNESKSTTYQNATRSTSTSVVRTGKNVLVLGTVDSTTIAAKDVSVEAVTSASSSASTVIPFDQGTTSAEKKVGTIPANWSAGQGALVSGSAANEATVAALAAYPGGVVDRVVVLSDGDYNVHF